MSIISPASTLLLKASLLFLEIDASKDPVKLWKLAEDIHLTAKTGLAVADQRIADRNYMNIQMSQQESFEQFLKRFLKKYQARRAAGCPRLAKPQQAHDLLESLNTNYKHLSMSLHNNAIMGVHEYPQDVNEVINNITNFKIEIAEESEEIKQILHRNTSKIIKSTRNILYILNRCLLCIFLAFR